jgi:hypothetical protein
MAVVSAVGSAKEIAWISAVFDNLDKIFRERIFPPVSAGKSGPGSVNRILIGLFAIESN